MRGELETEQNCNILTPTLMAITAFLCCSPGLPNRGHGGPASLGHGPHFSIWTPTDLNSNCSVGGPEGPLCWVLVLSTASYLQLTLTSCRWGYIIIWRPLFFLRVWQFIYLHKCISYFDSLAESEVNRQQVYQRVNRLIFL